MIGYSVVEIPILRLTNSITCIKSFQALCMSTTVVLVFWMTKRVASVPVSQFASAALALYPSFSLAPGATTNQILSATLAILAIVLFLIARERNDPKRTLALFAVCGAILAIAIFIQANASVVLIAITLAIVLWPHTPKPDASVTSIGTRCVQATAPLCAYELVSQGTILALDSIDLRSPNTDESAIAANKLLMETDLETASEYSKEYISDNTQKAENEGISYNCAASLQEQPKGARPCGIAKLSELRIDSLKK